MQIPRLLYTFLLFTTIISATGCGGIALSGIVRDSSRVGWVNESSITDRFCGTGNIGE